MNLLDRICQHAQNKPDHPALTGLDIALNYAELKQEYQELSRYLKKTGYKTIGLDADNIPAWIIVDLAALDAGVCLVPLPPFFSPQQVKHAITQAGIQAVITDFAERLIANAGELLTSRSHTLEVTEKKLRLIETHAKPAKLPKNIIKITYTSGTTGDPKGVMLTLKQVTRVIESLVETVKPAANDQHLPLMPLSVLLENIAGVYVSLWAGANVILPGLRAVGLLGSVSLDTNMLLSLVQITRPTTLIVTPQILQSISDSMVQAPESLKSIRFIALGGAPVSRTLLEKALTQNLPVYEGYGLSECASVTTLNTPENHRTGSVGKPLSHLRITIAEDGEILVDDHGFAGYLEKTGNVPKDAWHTGDLGYLDDDGYLYITGRKKNVFITSMGRNISPEWVESELVTEKAILQAAVFGEAKPFNVAVIVPTPGHDHFNIRQAIDSANQRLPDYARVTEFVIADEPFTPVNTQLSGTGRNRRENIYQSYASRLDNHYEHQQEYLI